MIKRIAASLLLAGASLTYATTRVDLRVASLDDLTARLEQGHGGDSLAAVARERASRLEKLAQSDPAQALRLALPDSSRALLSPRVRDFVEENVELEGSLEVLVEDRNDGSRRVLFLETDGGERFELSFASQPAASLTTGTRVKVSGVRFESVIAVASGKQDLRKVSNGLSTQSVNALSQAFGAQKTVVLLVNFSDNAVQPYTVASAQSVMSTTSNFDLENSYGQTWLSADVFGWYTIAQSQSVCDYNTTSSLARSAATAAGVNMANYNRYVIAFPSNACGWWGLGTVGGWPSTAWINGSFQLMVVGHEMGHNLGLDHSHSLDCGSTVLTAPCTTNEYGDNLDIMGSSSPYHFNSFQKERLGWLGYGTSPAITTVTANGSYTINAMETNSTASKALKIARGTTGNYFYVEARRGLGFDGALTSNANVSNGVVMHMAVPTDSNSSDLLDMTAGTSSWADPALVSGQSFYDSTSGVTISVSSASSSGAVVAVSFGGPQPTPTPSPTPTPTPAPSCTHVSPVVALSPGQSAAVKAGTQVSFTVSVTNKDVSPCTTSSFTVTGSVLPGWTGTLSAGSVSVAPGATGSVTLKVTSPTSAVNGTYSVSSTAKNSSATTMTNTGSASYLVSNPVSSTGGTITDTFDRPDSSSLGSAWTATSGNLVVASNMAKTATGYSGLSQSIVSALAGATQTVDIDFTSMDNNLGPQFAILLRYQDANNYYLIQRVTGGSSRLYISKVVNGVTTALANVGITNPQKAVSFHMTGRATGSTLSLDFNGVNKLNINDTTFANGHVGFQIYNKNSAVQQEADNFTATVQ